MLGSKENVTRILMFLVKIVADTYYTNAKKSQVPLAQE